MSTDYENIVRQCLKNGELWEDPDFAAVQGSVFYYQSTPFAFEWKRPPDLVPNPAFVGDQFDINPGKLGDRWFSSCLGCLRTSEGLLYRVVPADQGFDEKHDYVGIFRFRIWWCGEWKEVLIDDRLPTVNNKLVFLHSQHSHQPFWPALLEKAYAKLHGSYEALKYGSSLDCLSDLTGGIAESIPLKSESTGLNQTMANLLSMTSIITSKVHKDVEKDHVMNGQQLELLANGIVIGEAYRIYAMQKVQTLSGEMVHLLLLRSTTGYHNRYLGNWSQTSSVMWQKVDPATRDNLESYTKDGNFWMSYGDWLKTFTHLEVIHLDSDTAKDEPSLVGKDPWMLRLYHGRWQKGVSAGGCRNNTETFHLNPRLSLTLSESDEVVLALNQHTALDPKVIGFTGYKLIDNESDAANIGKQFFKTRKSLLNSQYTNSRQVSLRLHLEAGPLLVMPTAFEPGEEATFTFRVFSRYPVRIRIMDVVPAVVGNVFSRVQELYGNAHTKSMKDFKQYEPLFNQVADERRTINAFELQELLDNCLPNDYIKSCACLEVCRQVTVAFDSSGSGRITFSDFKNLMCSLKQWHSVFKNNTKEKSGILKAERLKDALLETGFRLNSSVLSAIMLRYIRKDGTLRFGDFVAIILNLSIAFDAFDKRDPLQTGTIRINRAEWIRMVISC